MNTLVGKVAIVTGASSGIGYATAKLFASEGASVVVAARRQRELDDVVKEIADAGGKAIALVGDVQDEAYARALVECAKCEYGGLDVAFNNAGILGELGPASDISLANWNNTLAINLTGAFLGAKYQLPLMLERGGGSMIFTSSFVGHTVGLPGMAAYASSKAGLVGLTKVLAAEYGSKKIRVNAIMSGGVDTPMGKSNSAEAKAFFQNMHALKRFATADEMAKTVLYLASDASSFTTGAALLIDGGVSINRT
jgi:NAD(P)-dependent dehydrogenase (short-subunit alcohol dehydrogenase family)